MQITRKKLWSLFLLKVKFASTSLVATAIDYSLYLLLVDRFFPPVIANIISFSSSVVINFLLQKRFVFKLNRKVSKAFGLSLLVSLGGLILSTSIVYWLSNTMFFAQRQYLTKLCATGIVFFYNFYMKRYVFEKRFF